MKSIVLLLMAFIAQSLYSQQVDVILIGGQSNATGQGSMKNIPRSFQIDTTVKIYYSRYLNEGANSERWIPLCQASDAIEKFGVELSLGTTLQRDFPENKIALIKHATSTTNLYKQWSPGNRPGETQGEEYRKFIQTVKGGLDKLRSEGYTPIVRAMVWQQGEADARDIAGEQISEDYGKNLGNLIRQIRTELNCDKMLFIYGEVLPLTNPAHTGREIVQHQQYLVSEEAASERSVYNAFFIRTEALQMRRDDYRTPDPNDRLHFGTFGILTLGERFAEKIRAHWE